jgi:hypothetical protein
MKKSAMFVRAGESVSRQCPRLSRLPTGASRADDGERFKSLFPLQFFTHHSRLDF